MYIVLAIFIFGILIATHELGHFLTAKACKVKVNEFAIGMGPAIFKKQKGETLYSLRLLPLGGFCAMEGEDESSQDPRAFTSQPAWKRLLILAAGAGMNFLTGLLAVLLLFALVQPTYYVTNTVLAVEDTFRYGGETGIQPGDQILSIDGHHIFCADDFSTYMDRADGPVDMTIRRDGSRIHLEDYPLQREEFLLEGETVLRYGITFETEEHSFGGYLRHCGYTTWNFVRMVEMGLSDLIRGNVGMKDLSGVVGIVDTISDVGTASPTVGAALANIGYLGAFIAVNLAVMNLLPIPALDGGRIFFLAVTAVIEAITKRKINPKYEGYIHAGGLVLLMGLMVVVMFNDIVRIIHG